MPELPGQSVRVFYCYAHEDKDLRDQLEKHLGNLKRQNQITNWHDRDISAGKEWKSEIEDQLNVAHIILLLISPDFMDSDYCYSVEMKHALNRHKEGKARVIPILLRSVDWEDAPFSKLQMLPTDAKPVTSWINRDEAFSDITKGIRRAVKELLTKQWTDKAWLSYYNSDYGEALNAFEEAISLDSNNATAYAGKGDTFLALARYEEALSAYEKAVYLEPDNSFYHIDRGTALRQLERYKEALDSYNKAISIDDFAIWAYYGKAIALNEIGSYEEALAAFDKSIQLQLELGIEVSEDYEYKGEILNNLGRYEDAAEIIKNSKPSARAYRVRGDSFLQLGRLEEALTSYEKSIEVGNVNNRSYIGKGKVLYRLGRNQEALAAFEQAIKLSLHSGENHYAGEAYYCKSEAYAKLAEEAREKADDLGYLAW